MLVTAADYPFIDVLGSLLIFAVLVGWIWTVVVIFGDLIARRDIRGGIKAGWIIIVLLLPIVGSIVYVVTNHDGMAERALRVSPAAPEQLAYVRGAAGDGGPAAEIAKAKELLDGGAITQGEYDVIKAKVMG